MVKKKALANTVEKFWWGGNS